MNCDILLEDVHILRQTGREGGGGGGKVDSGTEQTSLMFSCVFLHIFLCLPMFSRVFKGGIMQTQVFSEYLVYCPILGTDTTYDQKTPLVGDRGLLYYSVFVFKAYGLFTYYVSQKLGYLHPPFPLRQQWSAFG